MITKKVCGQVINMRLMKIIGFYNLLNPRSPVLFGNITFKFIMAMIHTIIIIFGITILFISLYYCLYNVQKAVEFSMIGVASCFALLKYIYVYKHSDRIWKCMHLTSDKLFSYNNHKKEILQNGLEKSIFFVKFYFALLVCAFIPFILLPIFMKDSYNIFQIRNSSYKYHYNSLNFVYPPSIISEHFYNENFKIFYIIEVIEILNFLLIYLLFDIIVISMCIAFTYQLKTIAHSFGTFINDRIVDNKTNPIGVDESNEKIVKDFKLLIDDLKNVIENMRETYHIIRPITLVQLASESTLIVLQPCILLMNYYNGISLTSPINISVESLILLNTFHLFVTCYLFGNLNAEKEALNFALYSSNWTNQCIHFKKLLFLAMNMNSAENLNMKVSFRKVFNLELFAGVIQTAFSVISVWMQTYRES